jgi:hypothetical protein
LRPTSFHYSRLNPGWVTHNDWQHAYSRASRHESFARRATVNP